MIRRPPRSTLSSSSAASDVYKRQSIDWVGGIVTSGFYDTLIENNVFDGVYHAAVTHMYPTGKGYPVDLSPKGEGYITIFRNNIILNTQKLSLIHISEPTRLLSISYAVFC